MLRERVVFAARRLWQGRPGWWRHGGVFTHLAHRAADELAERDGAVRELDKDVGFRLGRVLFVARRQDLLLFVVVGVCCWREVREALVGRRLRARFPVCSQPNAPRPPHRQIRVREVGAPRLEHGRRAKGCPQHGFCGQQQRRQQQQERQQRPAAEEGREQEADEHVHPSAVDGEGEDGDAEGEERLALGFTVAVRVDAVVEGLELFCGVSAQRSVAWRRRRNGASADASRARARARCRTRGRTGRILRVPHRTLTGPSSIMAASAESTRARERVVRREEEGHTRERARAAIQLERSAEACPPIRRGNDSSAPVDTPSEPRAE